MNINNHYQALKESYLFSQIAQKVKTYQSENPNSEIYRLGIGDATRPLAPAVVEAMRRAVVEMGEPAGFHGYGEEQGYTFLRHAVCSYYAAKGVDLAETEVFISDGAKSDLGNILDIFDVNNSVLIPDPVYPVYVDTNIMAGRSIIFANGNTGNGFLPLPDPLVKADVIYLCSPNNPTGAVYDKSGLEQWVAYALNQNAVLLFDSAYECFVGETELPTSIYQIEGARQCAIEFCSLSKTAGFTGTRCGYTVIPHELTRGGLSLNKLWLRRQTTKFNGVSYIVQRGAEAVFSKEGFVQIQRDIAFYMQNARLISDTLSELDIWFVGGTNAPYLWLKCPDGMSSWNFFDYLLSNTGIVGTPGAGFGANGEGFFRLSAFGGKQQTESAMEKLRKLYQQ